jgi:hypothetical protein
LSRPPTSTWAIELPPAPIERTSTQGVSTGSPTMLPWYINCGRPALTRQVSKLVPPTSAVITCSMPSRRAISPAPLAPATGPDMTVSKGREAASPKVIAPPPERVIR